MIKCLNLPETNTNLLAALPPSFNLNNPSNQSANRNFTNFSVAIPVSCLTNANSVLLQNNPQDNDNNPNIHDNIDNPNTQFVAPNNIDNYNTYPSSNESARLYTDPSQSGVQYSMKNLQYRDHVLNNPDNHKFLAQDNVNRPYSKAVKAYNLNDILLKNFHILSQDNHYYEENYHQTKKS
ncbi:MAG: hypothetical protein Gaeavirus31_4 [Gaeavirus sp.]|uniref:Uncharacterized protein n=1 Tax=Gaeavirus sp. TaxID=2487767 RepID=A0A3G4ZZM6_9VIRU|nr:MAG: hypothetical protein Gaeavirus31_4 [Gaeavirus sp.]